MTIDYGRLSPSQIDALGELANIGAGNSASVLSKLFGDKIMISVPKIRIISFQDVSERMKGADSKWIAVNLKVMGQVPGGVMFLFPWEEGLALAVTLRKNTQATTEELSEEDYSTLAQIGKVVGTAYIQAIGKMAGLLLTAKFRDVSSGSLKDLWEQYFNGPAAQAEKVIFAETEFDGKSKRIKGHLLFTPSGEHLGVLWQALGFP